MQPIWYKPLRGGDRHKGVDAELNFVPLLERTAKHFQVKEVSADKAYMSHTNLKATAKVGAMSYYIPFKVNTAVATGNPIWAEMYHYFMYNREEFLTHYHKRSNVEIAFSMIKAKFGDAVRRLCV